MTNMDPELKRRYEEYYARESKRVELGPSFINSLRYYAGDRRATASIVHRARDEGFRNNVIEGFRKAAVAKRSPEGINLDVDIRPITIAELEQFGDAARIHPHLRPSIIEGIKDNKTMVAVAFEDGEPVGHANLTFQGPPEMEVQNELGAPVPWLWDLWVNEGARSRGIAQALVRFRENAALALPGTPKIIGLAVEEDNETSIGLHRKMGYRERTINGNRTFYRRPYFEGNQGGERILMVKELE